MAKVLKEHLGVFIKSFFTNWLEDFCLLVGVIVILTTTYNEFGVTIGNYTLGIVLLILGFLVAKK